MAQQLRHQTFNSAKVGSLETPRVAELFKHLPLREFPGCLLLILPLVSITERPNLAKNMERKVIGHRPHSTVHTQGAVASDGKIC